MEKKNQLLLFIATGIPLVWIGLIVGISFMEAPLKFTAPGVSLSIGVGIGKIVFTAMKKVEWLLLCLWTISLLLIDTRGKTAFGIFLLFLVTGAQSFWLLPQLHHRITLIQQDITPPFSYLHIAYILTEVAKVLLLCYSAIQLFTHSIQIIITKTLNNDTIIPS